MQNQSESLTEVTTFDVRSTQSSFTSLGPRLMNNACALHVNNTTNEYNCFSHSTAQRPLAIHSLNLLSNNYPRFFYSTAILENPSPKST